MKRKACNSKEENSKWNCWHLLKLGAEKLCKKTKIDKGMSLDFSFVKSDSVDWQGCNQGQCVRNGTAHAHVPQAGVRYV